MMGVGTAFVYQWQRFYVIWYIIRGEASQVNASLANAMCKKLTKL